jgi:pyroglutamyl-peptidase
VRLRAAIRTFVCASLLAAAAWSGEPAAKPVVLLTGFEPFGGAKINPSWETVKTFQGKEIAGHKVETAQLPVVYDDIDKPLQAAIAKHKPAAVICFGVGSRLICVETVARNGYHRAQIPDNLNKRPPRAAIVPGAPKEIKTALPADDILAALKTAKIGAQASTDAGGYLCNECFYRVMNCKEPAIRGFVHVPDYGTPDPEGGVFDAAKLKRAVEIVVEAALKPAPTAKQK